VVGGRVAHEGKAASSVTELPKPGLSGTGESLLKNGRDKSIEKAKQFIEGLVLYFLDSWTVRNQGR